MQVPAVENSVRAAASAGTEQQSSSVGHVSSTFSVSAQPASRSRQAANMLHSLLAWQAARLVLHCRLQVRTSLRSAHVPLFRHGALRHRLGLRQTLRKSLQQSPAEEHCESHWQDRVALYPKIGSQLRVAHDSSRGSGVDDVVVNARVVVVVVVGAGVVVVVGGRVVVVVVVAHTVCRSAQQSMVHSGSHWQSASYGDVSAGPGRKKE